MKSISKVLDEALERSRRRTTIYATMGKRLPNGDYQFTVDGRPECVWVTMRLSSGAQTTVPAVNAVGIEHSPRLAVEMKKEDEDYIILRRSGKKSISTPVPTDPSGVKPHLHSHSGLSDLDADSHTQYHNDTRGDARYFRENEHINTSAGAGDAGKPIVLDSAGQIATNMLAAFKSYYDSVVATLTNKTIDASVNTLTNIGTTALSNDAVTNAKLSNMAQGTVKGRQAGTGTGDPEDLTAAQLQTVLETAIQYLKSDGTTPLTGDWNIGEDRAILAEFIKARDAEGLTVLNSSGNDIVTFNDSGNFETARDGSATVGDILVDVAGKTIYFGRLSPTSGDNTNFTWRNRLGTAIMSLDAAGVFKVAEVANALAQVGGGTGSAKLHIFAANTTGNGLQVIRNLTATSTDAPLVNFIDDHATNDQDLVRLQQDGTGKILTALAGVTEVLSLLTSGLLHAFSMTVRPGTASDTARVGGILFKSVTTTGNVGTGEDPLLTFSVLANVLAVDNQSIWFEITGLFAANANAKRVRVYFGSSGTTLVADSNASPSINNSTWKIRGRIFRTGAATQKSESLTIVNPIGLSGGSNMLSINASLNQTLSGAVDFRVTGEATSNNDITIETAVIGWDGENT